MSFFIGIASACCGFLALAAAIAEGERAGFRKPATKYFVLAMIAMLTALNLAYWAGQA